MVLYSLFQDNITGFNICFPIKPLGYYNCLCISYASFLVMIFLIIAQHPLVFYKHYWGFTWLHFRVKDARTYVSYVVFPIFLF